MLKCLCQTIADYSSVIVVNTNITNDRLRYLMSCWEVCWVSSGNYVMVLDDIP